MKIGDLVTIKPQVQEETLRGVIVGRFQRTPGTPRGYLVMTSKGIVQCYKYELLPC